MLVLLDRDGVINVDHPQGVRSIEEFTLIPQSAQAICALNQAGFKVAIVTNQALVGRGEISLEQLQAIHEYMHHLLKAESVSIDHVFYCTDTTIEPYYRRKPAPGMLWEAMNYFHATPEETVMVGDALRDLQAAYAVGCKRMLVRTGKGEKTLRENLERLQPIEVFDNLWQAVQTILTFQHHSNG